MGEAGQVQTRSCSLCCLERRQDPSAGLQWPVGASIWGTAPIELSEPNLPYQTLPLRAALGKRVVAEVDLYFFGVFILFYLSTTRRQYSRYCHSSTFYSGDPDRNLWITKQAYSLAHKALSQCVLLGVWCYLFWLAFLCNRTTWIVSRGRAPPLWGLPDTLWLPSCTLPQVSHYMPPLSGQCVIFWVCH